MNESPFLTRTQLSFVIAVFAILWFVALGYRDLAEPDEARYAEISREMLTSGDWVTPRLNYLKYFEKPPLQYWATAINFKLLGLNNVAVRLWPALLGFVTVLWIGWIGSLLYGRRAGLIAATMLASCLLWLGLGHITTLDMGVSAFLTFGIGALIVAQQRRDNPQYVMRWMLFGWTALALAMLSKGLIALVIPGTAIFLYMVWQRDWVLLRHLHLGKGLALFLLITAPWFILVGERNPGFTEFFFLHEHLQRFTTKVHGRAEPWWFFSQVLVIGALPWLTSTLQVYFRPALKPPVANQFDTSRFLWVYIVFILVFFSLSGSQLAPYILPLFPALALLIGQKRAAATTLLPELITLALLGLAVLLMGAQVERLQSPNLPLSYLLAMRPWFYMAGSIYMVGSLLTWYLARRSLFFVPTLGYASILGFLMVMAGYQELSDLKSARPQAEAIAPLEKNGPIPVYCIADYLQGLPWALHHPVDLVIAEGELAFGLKEAPQRKLSLDEFIERWQSHPQAAAVMYPEIYAQLQQRNVPMIKINETIFYITVKRQ